MASNTLFFGCMFVGGFALTLGFIIYGTRLIMRLKSSRCLRKLNYDPKNDDVLYEVTCKCILLSATIFTGTLAAIMVYVVYYLGFLDSHTLVIHVIQVFFFLFAFFVLLYTSKPQQQVNRHSIRLLRIPAQITAHKNNNADSGNHTDDNNTEEGNTDDGNNQDANNNNAITSSNNTNTNNTAV